jgi:hypothetical protein
MNNFALKPGSAGITMKRRIPFKLVLVKKLDRKVHKALSELKLKNYLIY